MDKQGTRDHWQYYMMLSLLGIIVCTIIAVLTKLWVITAIPIGFLFGFFLQKGDLCGSSAFSETIMFKDRSKLWGLWVIIVVGMSGFAILDLLGLVKLSPKPFFYISYLVGGIMFGAGMVFAGGCVSGCLFKSAAGNLNSIVALLGIPLGVMTVDFGFLAGINNWMRTKTLAMSDESVITVNKLIGMPYWMVALIAAGGTLLFVFLRRSKMGKDSPCRITRPFSIKMFMIRSWKPWVAGIAIGLLNIVAYISSSASGRNYPLGVTHGVMNAELVIIDNGVGHVYKAGNPAAQSAPAVSSSTATTSSSPQMKGSDKKANWWLIILVISLMLGSWTSAKMSGQFRLLPKPPDEMLFAILGGVLVGIGAGIGGGCVVGNIMSGWALLSVGTIIFGIATILSNWITTYFYMMGGRIRSTK
jgi:uncharacterized membrane protein YedE/YeeE